MYRFGYLSIQWNTYYPKLSTFVSSLFCGEGGQMLTIGGIPPVWKCCSIALPISSRFYGNK